MAKWQRLSVPPICERMLGFSVPQDGEVIIVSYEGMHRLRLSSPVTVETDAAFAEYDLFDPDSGLARYGGKEYQIIGLHGGNPLMNSPARERLVLNTSSQTLVVKQKFLYSVHKLFGRLGSSDVFGGWAVHRAGRPLRLRLHRA